MYKRRRWRSGIISGRLIISLIICLTMLPVTISAMKLLGKQLVFREEVQDEIALAQLRHILIVSDEFICYGNELHFLYQCEYSRLYAVNHHLILSPGTRIYLSDIDAVSFRMDEGLVCIRYERNGKEYDRILVHI